MKIIFLQNVLFDYRLGFFNQLVSLGYDITVVHSGSKNNNECLFTQIVVPKFQLGIFYYQHGIPNLNSFDVIVSMFDLHWLSNILPVLRRRNNRFLFWGHGLGRNKLGNKLRSWLIEKSDGVVLYNQQRKKLLNEHGVAAHLLFSANNTLLVSNAGREKNKRTKFLFVGRLHSRKRINILMRAFAATKPDKKFSISIIGDGEEMASLKALSISLGIQEQCSFLGQITKDTILKSHFDNAIAYVSPGPMGLGVNHAFAYGVPTLSNAAFKHGPETWVLNQFNSIWIDAISDEDQVSQLSDKMRLLMCDTSFADALGEQSFSDYQKYCSMDIMIKGFVEAFNC